MEQHRRPESSGSGIAKELLFGLIAIGLGGYNLLNEFLWKFSFKTPEILGSVLLILVGFVLLVTAFKLWRYKWHSRRLF